MSAKPLHSLNEVEEAAFLQQLVDSVPPEQREQAQAAIENMKDSGRGAVDIGDYREAINFLVSVMSMMCSEEEQKLGMRIATEVVEAQRQILAKYGTLSPALAVMIIGVIFIAQLDVVRRHGSREQE